MVLLLFSGDGRPRRMSRADVYEEVASPTGSVLAFLEACFLERDERKREAMIEAAAQRLTSSPNPQEDVAAIRHAFIDAPLVADAGDDQPPGAGSPNAPHLAELPGEAGPGEAGPDEEGKPIPRGSDDSRTAEEVGVAVQVLEEAVLRDRRLATAVHGIAATCAGLSGRTKDQSNKASLMGFARRLNAAVRAAGTKADPIEPPDEAAMRAFQAGADAWTVGRVAHYSKEWEQQREHGYRGDKDTYIRTMLERENRSHE